MSAPDLALVRGLEERAAAAWPALEVEELDGWRLRWTLGATRRANSVLANADTGRLPLDEKLRHVEAFYRERGGVPRFQLCPSSVPEGLDALLAERGYVFADATEVRTATLPLTLPGPDFDMDLLEEPTTDWLAVYCGSEGYTGQAASAREGILRRIDRTCRFALLRIEGEPAAVGLGVLEDGWVGLFCMATLPRFRRRGAATAVVRALTGWAEAEAAGGAYLQVWTENPAGLALYDRLSFQALYRYHYRELRDG